VSADPVRQIADAVLYEGYILWPYRRSALKNRQRFTFGGVFPPAHTARHEDDRSTMQTQCLVEGEAGASVDVEVRFLQVVMRQVADDRGEPVDELVVDGERHLSWEEATERELRAEGLELGRLASTGHRFPIAIGAQSEREELAAGSVVRSWRALEGEVEIGAERLRERLFRLSVRIVNGTPFGEGAREDALERTFCSTHTVIRTHGAELVSMTDPPTELREAAEGCENLGAWPVLVGEPGERRTLLSSPIILEDHPRIAPESPGDLFDGGEIDQLLTLNILSLTDEEKAEMRDSDPRAREILERTEALSEEELMALHGAIRDFSQLRPEEGPSTASTS
jgi:hypothetical protein